MDKRYGMKLLGGYLIGSGFIDFIRIFLLGYIARSFYRIFEGRDNAFIIALTLSNLIILAALIAVFLYCWIKIRLIEDRGMKMLYLLWSAVIILLPYANALMLRVMTECADQTQMMSMELSNAMQWAPAIIIVFAYVLCISMTGYYFRQFRYEAVAIVLFLVYFKKWYDSLLNMVPGMTSINVVKFAAVTLTGILVMISFGKMITEENGKSA